MKFSIAKSTFISGLQHVTSVIGSRTTLPVLSNVMMEAGGNSLVLTATDLEIRITVKLEASVEQEGKTTLPGKYLLNLIKKLPSDQVVMESGSDYHMRIKAGKYDGKLLGLATDDFPLPVTFTPVRSFTFNQGELSRMLDMVSYAASSDDSRKTLNGVLFAVKENAFTLVATDGKRLALVEKVADNFSGEDGQAIVPSKTALEIQRIFAGGNSDVSIEFGTGQASFSTESVTVTTKLIEGSYPNYRQVIPTSFQIKLDLPSAEFSEALQRVAVVTADGSAYMRMTFEDGQVTLAASSNIGESAESVALDYKAKNPVEVNFNPVFVLDPFKHLDADKVTLQMNDGFSPVLLSSDGFLYVIMPMRNSGRQ